MFLVGLIARSSLSTLLILGLMVVVVGAWALPQLSLLVCWLLGGLCAGRWTALWIGAMALSTRLVAQLRCLLVVVGSRVPGLIVRGFVAGRCTLSGCWS